LFSVGLTKQAAKQIAKSGCLIGPENRGESLGNCALGSGLCDLVEVVSCVGRVRGSVAGVLLQNIADLIE
jgi:hypothetical protein